MNRYLYDPAAIDRRTVLFSKTEILETLPQRHEFEQLDAIVAYDPENKLIAGVREPKEDEFWTRGHLPGRPIFPGVLMVEAAAQLCSFYCYKTFEERASCGFGGADHVRFRRLVRPGDRMLLIGRAQIATPRRCLFTTQGLVGDDVVFEATIIGVALPGST